MKPSAGELTPGKERSVVAPTVADTSTSIIGTSAAEALVALVIRYSPGWRPGSGRSWAGWTMTGG